VIRKTLRVLAAVALGFFGVAALLLVAFQNRLLYYPKPYEPSVARSGYHGTERLDFETPQGRQTAFYLPPKDAPKSAPSRLLVCFNGNASLALYWENRFPEAARVRASGTGILLVDYPGYGYCEGAASPVSMEQNGRAAMSALARHLDVPDSVLRKDLRVLGYSMGAAAALLFSRNEPTQKIALVAPFTSTIAMASRTVAWPLTELLHHRFDNTARLRELALRRAPPKVTIFHGTADGVIPFDMGKALADQHPAMVSLYEFGGASHDGAIDLAMPRILAELLP